MVPYLSQIRLWNYPCDCNSGAQNKEKTTTNTNSRPYIKSNTNKRTYHFIPCLLAWEIETPSSSETREKERSGISWRRINFEHSYSFNSPNTDGNNVDSENVESILRENVDWYVWLYIDYCITTYYLQNRGISGFRDQTLSYPSLIIVYVVGDFSNTHI